MGTIKPKVHSVPQDVTLRDGTPLVIRGITPADSLALRIFHKGLQSESIYRRYLEHHKILTGPEADHLCAVDYENRMAFVAIDVQDGNEHIVGMVSYDRLGPDHPYGAEVAISVADSFQRRGLGSVLFERLVNYARRRGIQYFVATFLFEDTGFVNLVRQSGLPMTLKTPEAGVYEARILLNVFSQN